LKQSKVLILGHKVNSRGQLRAIHGVFAALLGGLLLILSQPGWADTYRWTGDDGQTVYSQNPPADGRPYSKIGAPPPPADPAGARQRLDSLRQGQGERSRQQRQASEQQRKARTAQAAVEKNCKTARRDLDLLAGTPRRLFRLPDGSVRRLTAEEREAMREQAERYLKENCR
jgi:hypothetical protein